MSMYTLNGKLMNVFNKPETKDRETGEIRPASVSAQIMGENIMPSGEKRFELVTIKVHAGDAYKKLVGREVRIPVGMFVKDGQALWYALKQESQPITG